MFFSSAHRKNQSLALAVVKLYLSDQVTAHTTWVERFTGTVSFTKDYSRKSYFIQIYRGTRFAAFPACPL